MHTIRLPSLKTKSWWVISSATAFVFFFFCFFLYFLVAFTAERPEGKEEGVAHPQTKANPRRVRHRSCDAVMNGKKKKGEKEKERRTCSDSIAKAGLSLSLSLIIYYCLLFCHSFSSLLYISSLLTCLFLSVFLSWTFFFSCLACRLALLFLHFLFFFF